jgi:hypothetical protein
VRASASIGAANRRAGSLDAETYDPSYPFCTSRKFAGSVKKTLPIPSLGSKRTPSMASFLAIPQVNIFRSLRRTSFNSSAVFGSERTGWKT